MAILTIETPQGVRQFSFDAPAPLWQLLETSGVQQAHPCGKSGKCAKCAVTLAGQVSVPNAAEVQAGTRLSCQAFILGNARVTLGQAGALTQIQTHSQAEISLGTPMKGAIGAAVDIGTTTMVLQRYDLATGQLIGQSAMENPQVTIAADVMGRIGAAMDGQLDTLQQQVQSAIAALCQKAGGQIDTMVLTGNTTMLYLLTGRDPSCLSRLPFEADTLFDTSASLLDANCYLPPCMNAFVGADITCAVLASDLCRHGTALLCDIGTNGEIALWKEGILYVTSTAAGPAFEGAGISCGCSSIPGAIDRVWCADRQLRIHTIADAPALGLCGSGLIDAVAALLELEIMDETGALDEDSVILAPGVALLQKDIRAMQLAKAAIAAGIQTLLEISGTDCDQIEALYIAGGFGSHLNIASAARIGLIPEELTSKVHIIGNAALAGAAQLLLDEKKLSQVRSIAAASKHWNLGGNPRFNDNYMNAMLFPMEDDWDF